MSRSSCIKKSLFTGTTDADITALKAQLATMQTAIDSGTTKANVDLSAYVTKSAVLANVSATNYTKLDQLWLRFATQAWVNDQLADVQGAVNNIPDMMAAYAKKDEVTLAVADLPKKADKTAVDSLTTMVSGINVAVGENVAAINAEIAALKARLDAIEAIL